MVSSWADFAQAAPDLAAAIGSRFAANVHHIIGTIRRNGSVRLSGTEVVIDDEIRIGVMPGSHKLADLQRDPRVEIHSAPLEGDLGDGDAKLTGRLRLLGPVEGGGGGSWFGLDLERVSLVRVDGDHLVFTVWTPDTGVVVRRRR